MMMAYTDGDIIHEIETQIIKSEVANAKFSALCNNEHTEDAFCKMEMQN